MTITPAAPADLPRIARLYRDAFPEAMDAVFGRAEVSPALFEDLFEALHAFESGGFWVAREEGEVQAFIVVVTRVRGLIWFLMQGPAWRIARRWCFGRYGIGWRWFPRLIRTVWSARQPKSSTDHATDHAQVLSIVVAPAFQRRGVGTRLFEAALTYLRERGARFVRLEVDAAKPGPTHLYTKLGFIKVARISSPRGPALVMTRSF
jgi:ribosomal protein S18 acetylase RimI-like enzyme